MTDNVQNIDGQNVTVTTTEEAIASPAIISRSEEFPVGATASLIQFASAVEEDGNAVLRGGYSFAHDDPINRLLFAAGFAGELTAQGIEELDMTIIVRREEDRQVWVVNTADLEEGADVNLLDLIYTRIA